MKPSPLHITDSVLTGLHALEYLSELLSNPAYSAVFVLVDTHTAEHCLPQLKSMFPAISLEQITIPAGEAHKGLESCLLVWNELEARGADRASLLLNLGGGVVTDLGGFAAATFKRGIDFVHVPTSLLAMVDAAIGGKTGIDLGHVKNQIGLVQQPLAICVFPDFLNTLPARQLVNGLAEMFKHGLIASPAHWDELKHNTGTPSPELIARSAALKTEIVAADPHERGIRKVLNFGHTLGHAIESYYLQTAPSDYWLHGEAIACGMILEAYISHQINGLQAADLDDITQTLRGRFPRIPFHPEDIPGIMQYLRHDKKNSHGRVRFALLEKVGQPTIDIEVPIDVMQASFTYYSDL